MLIIFFACVVFSFRVMMEMMDTLEKSDPQDPQDQLAPQDFPDLQDSRESL